jgi:hypothetical protein
LSQDGAQTNVAYDRLRQQFGRQSAGSHAHPLRLVNEAADGEISGFWYPLLAPLRRTVFAPGQAFD